MTKTRRKKGGNIKPAPCGGAGQMKCMTQTGHGGSLSKMVAQGISMQKQQAEQQTQAAKYLAKGGRRRKRGGADRIICPQPAAGSGGTISAGGSSAGANMCHGTNRTLQQKENAIGDGSALKLSTAPPKKQFEGGNKKKNRKTKRRRKKTKRRRKSKRKRKKHRRKSRKHRY